LKHKELDIFFMARCLGLAKKGAGHVSPNPLVGCVIVRNGKILAEGYHKKIGGSHAEVEALKKLRLKAKGATLYCNLEPCFHYGRTPPCVPLIIKSQISRVVLSHRDPNPKVSGRSIRLLKKSGIKVTTGVLEKEARFLNRFFISWITKGRPYVILKVAMSLDGKIASNAKREWITNAQSRRRVHQLRSRVDAVLVGVNTVLQDNPLLNVRNIRGSRQPLRVVLDSHLRTPPRSKLFSSRGGKVLVVTGSRSPNKQKDLIFKGAQIICSKKSKKGQVSLRPLLKKLAKKDVTSVFVEGGAEVFSSFLNAGFCDELILFVAPKLLGAKALDAFPHFDIEKINSSFSPHSIAFHHQDIEFRLL